MKAMRRGNVRAASVASAASAFAGGSMASSIGRAMTVPNPFRKVRRGICQVLFITMFYGCLTDEITFQPLQRQAANSRERRAGRISILEKLRAQATSSKFQAPKKHQASSSKNRPARRLPRHPLLGFGVLRFGTSLELGAWCLVFRSAL